MGAGQGCVTVTATCRRLTLRRAAARKLWKAGDQRCFSASFGEGSRGIMKMTRMGCTAQRGGVTSAISIALTPNAHTSTCPHTKQASAAVMLPSRLIVASQIVKWPRAVSLKPCCSQRTCPLPVHLHLQLRLSMSPSTGVHAVASVCTAPAVRQKGERKAWRSCLAVVAGLLDDFRGHPVRGPDEGVALGHGARQLRGHPKIRQLDLPALSQQNVPALDIPMHLHRILATSDG